MKLRGDCALVWRDVNGSDRLAAQVEDGRVVRFGYDQYPFMLFEPVAWWWSSAWLLPLWIAALVALALTVLAWPFSALIRRHYGVNLWANWRGCRAHRFIRLASLLVMITMLSWVFTLTMMPKISTGWHRGWMDGLSLSALSPLVIFIVGTWSRFAMPGGAKEWTTHPGKDLERPPGAFVSDDSLCRPHLSSVWLYR